MASLEFRLVHFMIIVDVMSLPATLSLLTSFIRDFIMLIIVVFPYWNLPMSQKLFPV